jgi:hypothetical protein
VSATQDKKGPAVWPVTDAWKQSLRAWLRDNGVARSDLAKQVGCEKSAITWLLSESKPIYTSKLVPEICRVTGLAPPTIDFGDPRIRRLLDWAYKELERDPENFGRLIGIILAASEAESKKAKADREREEAIRQLDEAIRKR